MLIPKLLLLQKKLKHLHTTEHLVDFTTNKQFRSNYFYLRGGSQYMLKHDYVHSQWREHHSYLIFSEALCFFSSLLIVLLNMKWNRGWSVFFFFCFSFCSLSVNIFIFCNFYMNLNVCTIVVLIILFIFLSESKSHKKVRHCCVTWVINAEYTK